MKWTGSPAFSFLQHQWSEHWGRTSGGQPKKRREGGRRNASRGCCFFCHYPPSLSILFTHCATSLEEERLGVGGATWLHRNIASTLCYLIEYLTRAQCRGSHCHREKVREKDPKKKEGGGVGPVFLVLCLLPIRPSTQLPYCRLSLPGPYAERFSFGGQRQDCVLTNVDQPKTTRRTGLEVRRKGKKKR